MVTAVEEVERYIQTDLALHDALSRGFLNVRRAARWLIDTHRWDATEEAVVSALRRYEAPATVDMEAARHLLRATNLTAETGLAIVRMPRKADYIRSIAKVIETIGPADTLAIITERKHYTVLLEDQSTEAALVALQPEVPDLTVRGVTSIELVFPEDGSLASTALAMIINVFGHKSLDVLAVYGALPESSIVVPDEQASQAYYVALAMTALHET